MPTYPKCCEERCPRPQANPCCFLSIKKSVKAFHIFNCVFGGTWVIIFIVWSFWFSRRYDVQSPSVSDECRNEVVERLNLVLNDTDFTIEENSVFEINSLLRLRGMTFASGELCCIFFIAGSSFILRTFFKKPAYNRTHANITFWIYFCMNIGCFGCNIFMIKTLYTATHGCVLAGYRFVLILLSIFVLGPYKVMEFAVTIQYLRCLAAFAFTKDVMGRQISPDEPGWLISLWRSRRKSRQKLDIEMKEAKEKAQTQDEEYIVEYLTKDEKKYRKTNKNRIERNELAEQVTWFERVGKYQQRVHGTFKGNLYSNDPKSLTSNLPGKIKWAESLASSDDTIAIEDESDKNDESDTMTEQSDTMTIRSDRRSVQSSVSRPSRIPRVRHHKKNSQRHKYR